MHVSLIEYCWIDLCRVDSKSRSVDCSLCASRSISGKLSLQVSVSIFGSRRPS